MENANKLLQKAYDFPYCFPVANDDDVSFSSTYSWN